MSILFALAAAAAQGVSYAPPPADAPFRPNDVVTYPREVATAAPAPAPDARAYRLHRRGDRVPSHWSGPGFTVLQPGAYGFRQPIGGQRWIRYYDDALLVDRSGRVHDGRYGYDWNRYRDRWGRDGYGIPIYVGDGDFFPESRDYRWAERMERDEGGQLAYDRDYPYDFRYGGEGLARAQDQGGYTIVETTTVYPTTYREVTTYED